MILTEEQIKADNERWKARDIKQELYYLGYSIPNRLCVTNDNLRFNAFVARKALKMVEQLSAQPEIIRCRDCENYQTDWKPTACGDMHYCAVIDLAMPPDGYCFLAERRETDG